MGPEVAAAASLGSLGLDVGGSLVKGYGENQMQEFLARKDERSAAIGRIKADQTDTALREELTSTLGLIDVTRAAAGTDPLSPTGVALRERQTEVSDRNRRTVLANIESQIDESLASAEYRRGAGRMALLGGALGAGGRLLKGFSQYKG